LQGVEDGLAAWGRIAHYQRREALLALGESALVPLCPQALRRGPAAQRVGVQAGLRGFGLPTPNGVLSSPRRAPPMRRPGYPLVLKAVSAQLPHKTEAGAVALNLRDGGPERRWNTCAQHCRVRTRRGVRSGAAGAMASRRWPS
jgi:acyl-CoA synthetase (NDP forming)